MITYFPKYLNFKYIINFLIILLPLSFIAGNLIVNLNLIIITLVSIFYYGKDILRIKLNSIDKLLIVLFIYALIVGVINYLNFPEKNNIYAKENFFKSISFLRYLLFYFSVKLIVENKIFNYKLFFLVSSIAVLFVIFDVVFQLIVGQDIFGNIRGEQKISGPFGDELIAGSYIQRFSIFLFFLLPIYFKSSNRNNLIIILSALFILVFFSVVLTGNRMPTILFFLMFLFLFFMEKKLRRYSILFTIVSIVCFFIIFIFNQHVQEFTQYFLRMCYGIFIFLQSIFTLGNEPILTNTYVKEFYSGYMAWKENILLGGGINSFYLNCSKTIPWCASHPHNYYIEILSELGLIGLLIIILIVFKLTKIFFKNKPNLSLNFENNIILPFALLLIIEFFPLKTSGSFFTTWNTTFIIFLIAIIANFPKNLLQLNK